MNASTQSRRRRTLLGWLLPGVILATGGCSATTKYVRNELVREIERETLVRDSCDLYVRRADDPTHQLSGFIGDDPAALFRIATSIWGGAVAEPGKPQPAEPWAQILKDMTSIAGEESRLKESIEKLRTEVVASVAAWTDAYRLIGTHLQQLRDSGTLKEINACASRTFKSASVGAGIECAFHGAYAVMTQMRAVTDLAAELEDKREQLRRRNKDLLAALKEFEGLVQQHRLGGDAAALTPRVLALGGILRDGQRYLAGLRDASDKDVSTGKALFGLGKLLIDAQSDRIVDLSLFFLGKAVRRLEELLAKLDAQAYGLASAPLALAVRMKGTQRGMCRLAKEIRRHMLEAGINEHAFGARVCYAATTARKDYPDSALMSQIFGALVRAGTDLACEDREPEASPLTTVPDLEIRKDVRGYSSGSKFRMLGQDTAALARTHWDTRVQIARGHVATLRTQRSAALVEDMMPLLGDVPPMLHAAFLDAELSVPEAPIAGDGEKPQQTETERFALLVDHILLHAPPAEVVVNLCADPALAGAARPPLLCQGDDDARRDAALVAALGRVSDEMCEQKARLDRQAAVRSLCGAINAAPDGRGDASCIDAGYHAVLSVSTRDLPAEKFLPMDDKELRPIRDSGSRLARRLVDEIRHGSARSENYGAHVQRLRFQGRASTPPVSPADTQELVLAALAGEVASGVGKCEEFVDALKAKWNAGTNKLRNSLDADSAGAIGRRIAAVCGPTDRPAFPAWQAVRPGSTEVCRLVHQIVRKGKSCSPQAKAAYELGHLAGERSVSVTLPNEPTGGGASGWVTRALERDPRNLGNDLLAVLRALGGYQLVDDVDPQLCASSHLRCEINGLAAQAAEKAEQGQWQSFSILVEADDEVPHCRSK